MVDPNNNNKSQLQLQAEYEAFMLGRGGGKTKTTTPTPTISSTKTTNAATTNAAADGTIFRDVRSIFTSYQGQLKEWLDDDKLVLTLLESISHLRGRVRWEREEMLSFSTNTTDGGGGNDGALDEEEEDCGDDYDNGDVAAVRGCWKNYGFRPSPPPPSLVAATETIGWKNYSASETTKTTLKNKTSSSVTLLRREDIELALDHDLLQHEKMMSVLRSVLRSMGQNIDTIGRRLDEWMMAMYKYEQQEQHRQHHGSIRHNSQHHLLILKWKHQLELAQKLFVDLSKDLFWKQKALEQVLSSYHDRLLLAVSPPSSNKFDSMSTISSSLELQQHGGGGGDGDGSRYENVVKQIVKDIHTANRNNVDDNNNSTNIRSRIEEVLLAR